MSINAFMSEKHKECDHFFTSAENAVNESDWTLATQQYQAFHTSLESHLCMEEEVLFPEFEASTGMTQGPTQVMRMEHVQMRSLCEKLSSALDQKNKDSYLANADTLMILMQQHNMKEEQMLYPMADRVLNNAEVVIKSMQNNHCVV